MENKVFNFKNSFFYFSFLLCFMSIDSRAKDLCTSLFSQSVNIHSSQFTNIEVIKETLGKNLKGELSESRFLELDLQKKIEDLVRESINPHRSAIIHKEYEILRLSFESGKVLYSEIFSFDKGVSEKSKKRWESLSDTLLSLKNSEGQLVKLESFHTRPHLTYSKEDGILSNEDLYSGALLLNKLIDVYGYKEAYYEESAINLSSLSRDYLSSILHEDLSLNDKLNINKHIDKHTDMRGSYGVGNLLVFNVIFNRMKTPNPGRLNRELYDFNFLLHSIRKASAIDNFFKERGF